MKTRLSLIIFCICSLTFGGCGLLDELGLSSIPSGMYYCPDDIAVPSDFTEINTAINNNELIYKTPYGTYKTYATVDLFIRDDGSWDDFDAHHGRFRFSIKSQAKFIKVKNSSTVNIYYGWLYKDGTGNGGDKLHEVNVANPIGKLAYYDTPMTYSYVFDGSRMTLDNGDVYIYEDGALIPSGSNKRFVKK